MLFIPALVGLHMLGESCRHPMAHVALHAAPRVNGVYLCRKVFFLLLIVLVQQLTDWLFTVCPEDAQPKLILLIFTFGLILGLPFWRLFRDDEWA